MLEIEDADHRAWLDDNGFRFCGYTNDDYIHFANDDSGVHLTYYGGTKYDRQEVNCRWFCRGHNRYASPAGALETAYMVSGHAFVTYEYVGISVINMRGITNLAINRNASKTENDP